MESLIPVVNKLQDVFGAIGQSPVDLPQIVVIGAQSSGKSSVLENIVGRDFLPRGIGIVTRRPLVLQLHNVSHYGSEELDRAGSEWGEFLHLPGQRFYDFSEIRDEIQRETDRLTGRNKGISNKTINLRIFSPDVLNLTLVDLPGITKVSIGDQPEDIEDQIRNMCLHFISNPNAIVLAVSAANTDLANSDAIKLARMVDPEGMRTIGVLTKMDLMDPGTDCADILMNRVIPLKRGYIGVVNRGQRDIEGNLPIRDGQRRELEFFQHHPKYKHMLDKCTTPVLARALNHILMQHIRDTLPDIKNKLMAMLSDVNVELEALGEATDTQSSATLGSVLLRLVSKFVQNFQNGIDGRGSTHGGLEMTELFGGARISFIFNHIFGRSLMELDPFDGLSDEDIRTVIANSNGPRPSLFVPEMSFDLLVRRQIQRLEQPGLQCVDLVFDELQRMAAQCENTELRRFPELRDRMLDVVNQLLRKAVAPTQSMISHLVKIELSYINTSHPDFIGGSQAVAQLTQKMNRQEGKHAETDAVENGGSDTPTSSGGSAHAHTHQRGHSTASNSSGDAVVQATTKAATSIFNIFAARSPNPPSAVTPSRGGGALESSVVKLPQVPERMRNTTNPSDRERVETEIIKSLISSYFNIVRKNFLDMVPKTIMFFLVNTTKDQMQNDLVCSLYKEELMGDLMREEEDIAQRRRNCREMHGLLRRAMEIVNEVRDFNTFK